MLHLTTEGSNGAKKTAEPLRKMVGSVRNDILKKEDD